MFATTRILVPVDFSGTSDAALRRASDLAERTGAVLHILHVVPGPASSGQRFDDLPEQDRAFYRRFWDEADEQMTAFLHWIDPGDIRVKRVLSGGLPSRVTLEYAEREKIDLIVMGTHGRRGLRRFLLGSVAGEVLRRATVPLMIVPEASAGRKPLRQVLAPTDFSEASHLALPVAAGLAGLYGANLDLLHALEPIRYIEALTGTEVATEMLPDLRTLAEHRLEAFAVDAAEAITDGDEYDDAPVEGGGRVLSHIRPHLAEGRAAETIAEFARSQGTDMIVMAKHGLHGVERWLVGSVTERVCRLTPCPVLVVPIGRDEDV